MPLPSLQMLFIWCLMFNEEEIALPRKQIKARTTVLERSDCITLLDWICL